MIWAVSAIAGVVIFLLGFIAGGVFGVWRTWVLDEEARRVRNLYFGCSSTLLKLLQPATAQAVAPESDSLAPPKAEA